MFGIVLFLFVVFTSRIEGFDELGAVDTFSTETLERRLAQKGMIDFEVTYRVW